jgi:hypothetical protein
LFRWFLASRQTNKISSFGTSIVLVIPIMKKLTKIFAPLYTVSLLAITFFLISTDNEKSPQSKINFYYKDGLFYKKNSTELFSGKVIDTADVIIEFEVSNGKKNGRFTTYFLEGGIEKAGIMVDDKNEGTWKYFYPNGQIETIGNFYNNKPDGEWISYYPDGTVKTSGIYRNGDQHSGWYYYDSRGELINVLFLTAAFLKKCKEAFNRS